MVRDAAVRGLCNWPDATVADQLLELARSATRETQRIWALRGYARVVVLGDTLPPAEMTAGLQQAMQLATRLEDKQLILSGWRRFAVPKRWPGRCPSSTTRVGQRDAMNAVFCWRRHEGSHSAGGAKQHWK